MLCNRKSDARNAAQKLRTTLGTPLGKRHKKKRNDIPAVHGIIFLGNNILLGTNLINRRLAFRFAPPSFGSTKWIFKETN